LIRSVAAVVAGYLFKGIAIGLFFILAGWQPEEDLSTRVVVVGMVYRAFASVLAGYVTGLVARRRETAHALAVAILSALITIVSMMAGAGGREPLGAQVVNLLVMAPAVVVGGYLRNRQVYLKGDPEA
jgi:peptidoglycan/LPS O-acetylase OafA/YrhL